MVVRDKYRQVRWDSLCICNEFSLPPFFYLNSSCKSTCQRSTSVGSIIICLGTWIHRTKVYSLKLSADSDIDDHRSWRDRQLNVVGLIIVKLEITMLSHPLKALFWTKPTINILIRRRRYRIRSFIFCACYSITFSCSQSGQVLVLYYSLEAERGTSWKEIWEEFKNSTFDRNITKDVSTQMQPAPSY